MLPEDGIECLFTQRCLAWPIMFRSLFQGQNCSFGSSQSIDFFENRFSFQSRKWPGGLDDAWGQCDRTKDDYKKFTRQMLLEWEGTLEVTESSLLFVWLLA